MTEEESKPLDAKIAAALDALALVLTEQLAARSKDSGIGRRWDHDVNIHRTADAIAALTRPTR